MARSKEGLDVIRKANVEYKKNNSKLMAIRFYNDDIKLYEYAKTKPSAAKYIKELIRKDMEQSDE